MAGAINRPQFDKLKLDKYTQSIMPRLSEKLIQGDNELLSFIAGEFEKKGYQIQGASDILPNLTLERGFLCGSSYEFLSRDIRKADNILKLLSPSRYRPGSCHRKWTGTWYRNAARDKRAFKICSWNFSKFKTYEFWRYFC